MDNYIMFEGRKIPLTEEQVAALKNDHLKESSFSRKLGEKYFYIGGDDTVYYSSESYTSTDDCLYNLANYCTDKELITQRSLHETLDRLLWRFSMENGEMDNPWDGENFHYRIVYINAPKWDTVVEGYRTTKFSGPYFNSREVAQRAIEEIIKPFMEKHPDFVW